VPRDFSPPACQNARMSESTFERLRAALADHYDLGEELGAGGMLTVYRADDLKHERKAREGAAA